MINRKTTVRLHRLALVTLLGSDGKLAWSQTAEALVIDAPQSVPNGIAAVFKITPRQ